MDLQKIAQEAVKAASQAQGTVNFNFTDIHDNDTVNVYTDGKVTTSKGEEKETENEDECDSKYKPYNPETTPATCYDFLTSARIDFRKREVEAMRREILEEVEKMKASGMKNPYSNKQRLLNLAFKSRVVMQNRVVKFIPAYEDMKILFADCIDGLSKPTYNAFKTELKKNFPGLKNA